MAISGISGGFPNLSLTTSVQDRAQKLFKDMDADADGKVSKQELTALGDKMKANGPRRAERGDAAEGAKAPKPPSAEDILTKADTDGDSSLSVTELSALMAEHETHAAARGGAARGGGGPPPGGPPPGGPPPGGPPPGGAPPGGAPPGQARGGAGSSEVGGSASASSASSEDSDPADTNGDGNVSAAEKLLYELSHPNVDDTAAA